MKWNKVQKGYHTRSDLKFVAVQCPNKHRWQIFKILDKDGAAWLAPFGGMQPSLGLAQFFCDDCGRNTFDEYFMIQDELWDSVAPHDIFLCVGCLEARLERRLALEDFKDAPCNQFYEDCSPRLLDRLKFIEGT